MCTRFSRQNTLKTRVFRVSGATEPEYPMHDTLQAARELARQWREAKGDEAAGGVVLILDGLFVGHAPELPPAALWVPGCLAIAGDGHAHYIHHDWRRPLEWLDLDPAAAVDPLPSSSGSPDDPPPETTTEP